MSVSVGLVGLGSFGSAFADMFMAHPLVGRIALCDMEPERMAKFAEKKSWEKKLRRSDIYHSLDDICRSDLDALVIITQPWLHAPQCVKAMESGKHVYSAVPLMSIPDDDETLGWCDRIIETCKRTGLHYMLGETTFYRPEAMFCRRKAREGAFGNFVYAEGEYFHDVDSGCSLRRVRESRESSKSGREWAEKTKTTYLEKGVKYGPMHYPTHSVSGPVCVMGAHALKVVARGYRNQNNDPFFDDHSFSDEVAMFTMSNGATVRICEFRECAGKLGMEEETFRIVGTSGSFSERTWYHNGRVGPMTAKPLSVERLSPEEMRDPLPPEVAEAFRQIEFENTGVLSEDFVPKGHGGSHPYLVHEFVEAVAQNRRPAINAWEAARYMAMGVSAHKSALMDGEAVSVPDWGDAPKD